MAEQGGGGRRAVRAGDGDRPGTWQEVERDLDLADDGDSSCVRGRERRRGRGNAGTRHDERRLRDTGEIVATDIDIGAGSAERGRGVVDRRPLPCVRDIDADAFPAEQRRDAASALPEADDRDLTGAPGGRDHRSFSVVRATNAQRIPRIQKRTTTWVSRQPFISKWW